jgi:uncharacterized Zn-binding protein involved in type VI secretion
MAGICVDGDSVGTGAVIGSSSNVFAHGKKIALIGDAVTPHSGGGAHNSAIMITGSSKVFVNGRGVVRSGDVASCGHTVISSLPDISGG